MNRVAPRVLLAFAASLLMLAGCTDDFTSSEPRAPLAEGTTSGSKLRHAHLVDRALRVEPGKSAADGTVGVVIGLSGTVLDKQKFIDRYKLVDRYKLIERYQYDKVFKGVSVAVDAYEFSSFMSALDSDPEVLWYEPDIYIDGQPNAASVNVASTQIIPWSLQRIGATTSSALSGDGTGTVAGVDVVILDTGISNPDVTIGLHVDVPTTILLKQWVPLAADVDGHGTHIAGIIGAIDDLDGLAGIAPGVSLINCKVADTNGLIDLSSVVAAVEYITLVKLAYPYRKVVVNISLGTDVGTTAYNALDEAIRASTAAGVVYVVAAGNHGRDVRTVSPAHTAEAITVGAYDRYTRFASFSNHGSLVDILAPGVDIPSLVPEATTSARTAIMSGTSMAAAHVTGAAALYMSRNTVTSAQAVRNALVAAGQDVVTGTPNTSTTRRAVHVGTF